MGRVEVMQVTTKIAVLCALLTAETAAAPPASHECRHYVLHTDLAGPEAREATLRLTRMAQLYLQRTEGFAGKIDARMRVYLYGDPDAYERSGAAKGSAGVFDGERLLVLAIRRKDGSVANATWRVMQHEGFHQFARAVIGGEIPTWANEGLAEYFAEAVFTGDGFVTGPVPQERLVRLRKMLTDGRYPPLKDFLELSREGWNAQLQTRNYDLSWSLVHFFAHGGGGTLQDAFAQFMNDVAEGKPGGEALRRRLGTAPDIERAWRAYWLGLPDEPTTDRYARATVAMLTSFLARAHAAGHRFDDFDKLVQTPAGELEFAGDAWLPITLWKTALEEVRLMRDEGARFNLLTGADGLPEIDVALRAGTRVTGTFTLRDGKVADVVTRVGR